MSTVTRMRGTAVTDEQERVSAILARAGQFCCTSYAQQLLREPERKLGTVMWRIDYGIGLLRQGEDLGMHVGQALRFCLARLPRHDPIHPMRVFSTAAAILAEASRHRKPVDEALGYALTVQRTSDPDVLLRTAKTLVAAEARGTLFALAVRSCMQSIDSERVLFLTLDGLFAAQQTAEQALRLAIGQQRLRDPDALAAAVQVATWRLRGARKRLAIEVRPVHRENRAQRVA